MSRRPEAFLLKTHRPPSVFGAKVESFFQTPATPALNVYNKRYKEQKCKVCVAEPPGSTQKHCPHFTL